MLARDGRWTPIAPTPTRDNADVNSIALIKAFFEDFPGSIATRAVERKDFEDKGFDSKESLKGILTRQKQQTKTVLGLRSYSKARPTHTM